MVQPAIRDTRFVDPMLSRLSIGFKNPKFHWDSIAPVVSTQQKSGIYPVYSSDYWFRLIDGANHAEGALYARGGYGITSGSYECFEIGVEKLLPDSVSAASQLPEALEVTDVAWLTNQIQLQLEVNAANKLFKAGVWGTDRTGHASSKASPNFIQWSDYANSDPIQDIRTGISKVHQVTGARPEHGYTNYGVMESLLDHPLLHSLYKRNSDGPLTTMDVARALNLTDVGVADSIYDTGVEGSDNNDDTSPSATFTNRSYVFGNHFLVLLKNTPQLGVVNGAYTYIFDEAGNVPWAMQLYRDDARRSDVRRVFTWPQPVVVSPHHGYFFSSCIT